VASNRAAGRRPLTVAQLNVLVLATFVGLWLVYEFAGDRVRWVMFFAIVAILTLGLMTVVYGTIRKNKWGINFDSVACPCCGTVPPKLRKPKTVRQALWGGWTCARCGTEVDKWGREVLPAAGVREQDARPPETSH
jgi:hypothetical protein